MIPRILPLNYGVQTIALGVDKSVTIHFDRDEMHVDHVNLVVDGREAGGFSGNNEQCEVWVSGWISGWLSRNRVDR